MSTGFVWHERYMWHDTGNLPADLPPGHLVQPNIPYENPETKRRLRNLIEVTGLSDELVPIRPRPATEAELLRFHTPEYIARIQKLSDERGGEAGEIASFGYGSYDIARLAVGGVIEAVDAVLDGQVNNVYALIRPPGHHAEPDRGRGFCIFGNIALAVMHAQRVRDLGRIAVVDWDVHHGNGTQLAFYEDPDVLTISLHQDRRYPFDTGFLDENGTGEGEGFNINVPLPPGSGHGAYIATVDQVVVPALLAYRPELIVVACGLDAAMSDPLGRMMCYSDTYREMTRMLKEVAADQCEERLVMAHEGGYSTTDVPTCGLAVVEELAGCRTGREDSAGTYVPLTGGFELQPHQKAIIDEAANLVHLIG